MLTRRNMFKASLMAGVSAAGLGGSAFAEEGANIAGAHAVRSSTRPSRMEDRPADLLVQSFPVRRSDQTRCQMQREEFRVFSGQKLSRGSDGGRSQHVERGV